MTPFILLIVHRNDDAFDFIRYWMKMHVIDDEETTDTETRVALRLRLAGSKEGDWIYPREKNCRFLNMFEECPAVNDEDVPLAFLVALFIIKCRIVAAYDAACGSIDLAFGTTGGQRIHEVLDVVKEMLFDENLVNIENQRKQVEQLMKAIHRNNPSMLPAIVNPRPFLNQVCPQVHTRGHPSEAYYVPVQALPLLPFLLRLPVAATILKQRLGECPP